MQTRKDAETSEAPDRCPDAVELIHKAQQDEESRQLASVILCNTIQTLTAVEAVLHSSTTPVLSPSTASPRTSTVFTLLNFVDIDERPQAAIIIQRFLERAGLVGMGKQKEAHLFQRLHQTRRRPSRVVQNPNALSISTPFFVSVSFDGEICKKINSVLTKKTISEERVHNHDIVDNTMLRSEMTYEDVVEFEIFRIAAEHIHKELPPSVRYSVRLTEKGLVHPHPSVCNQDVLVTVKDIIGSFKLHERVMQTLNGDGRRVVSARVGPLYPTR